MATPEEYSRTMTKRVLLKLDLYILPPLAMLWLANFIDRSNIGNARIAGLERDTHLHGTQFNTALAVFYVTYILVEVPSNIILKKVKPDRWIPFLVLVWGIMTMLTGVVHNFGGLVAIRMALGFCEGGLLPGLVLYLSTMYKRHELQLRVGIFYASASLSGAFGGLLATAILKMNGVRGMAGWRWIFILEGLATIIIAIVSSLILPSDLSSAKFLTPEERDFAVRRFQSDDVTYLKGPATEAQPDSPMEKESGARVESPLKSLAVGAEEADEEYFEWREVIRGITDIQTWLTGLAYFAILVSLYSYSLFLPTIMTGLGYSGSAAQLHTVPPYVPATILTVIVAILADRLKWRGPFILIFLPLAIIGYIIVIAAKANSTRYIAVFFMAVGVYPTVPCVLSILPNNTSGHYKKATTTALQLAIANASGFVATFVYTPNQAPKYIRGHSIVLGFQCLAWILIVANVCYCKWENKARSEGRRQGNIENYQRLWNEGKTRAPIGDRHPDFRFTL